MQKSMSARHRVHALGAVVLGAGLSACGFQASNVPDGGGGSADASTDAVSPRTFGEFITVTFDSLQDIPTQPLTLSNQMTIDTGSSELCNTHTDQSAKYCVVAASQIKIDAMIATIGPKPIIFLAVSSFELNDTINANSVRGGQTGAGATAAASPCTGKAEPTGTSGGYGGSFGGTGGTGTVTVVGTGGAPAMPLGSFPNTLGGGCAGGNGAGIGNETGGSGGASGGAIDVIADTITLNGQINASGASGAGGTKNSSDSSGGGGGGSGGMIVLDTHTVTAPGSSSQLFANGGGGGQGGTGNGNGNGDGDGGNESPGATMPAIGGQNSNRSGGAGGNGSAGTKKDGEGGATPPSLGGGGGGGGGAAGFIRTPAFTGADVSPASSSPS